MNASYNIGDRVEVHRRVDPNDKGAVSVVPREWKPATITSNHLGQNASGAKVILYTVHFDDGYVGGFGRGANSYSCLWLRSPRLHEPEITHTVMMQRSAPAKKLNDDCPVCHDRGEWRGLALVCRQGHGIFAG